MVRGTRSKIRRYLAAGSVVAVTGAVLALTVPNAGAAAEVVVKPSADAYVSSDQPTANFGSTYVLDAEAGSATTPTRLSYLRFTVTGLTKPAAGVTLRLYSYSMTDKGLQVWTAANNWTQPTLSYSNAPIPSSTMVGAIPRVATDTWASLDVSNVVTGNGTYTFVISTTDTRAKHFASSESGGSSPQLVFQISNPPATVAATAGSGQSASPGSDFATQLGATVTDGAGAGVPDVQVTFTAPSWGPSGSFAGGSQAVSVTTGPDGVARAPVFTADAQSGSYTVTAAAAGVDQVAQFALTNSTGGPAPSSDPVPPSTPPLSTAPAATLPASSSGPPSMSAPTSPPSPSPTGTGSGTTATTTATTTTTTTTTTSFSLAADAYVRADQADTNFGSAYTLYTEAGSPAIVTYLAVNVSGLTGTVTSAVLQLFSYSTYGPGVTVHTTSPNWTEAGITYASAPALGAVAGTGPNLMLNTVASIDLGTAITGNGTYSFAVTTDRTKDLKFGSRESGARPQVVITTTSGGTSPPPSTPPASGPPPSSAPPSSGSAAGITLQPSGGAVQSTAVGTAFASPLTVTASEQGDPVPGLQVTFQAPDNGPSATFPGGANSVTMTTGADGTATTPQVTANSTAGTYAVVAGATGVTQNASFTLTNGDVTIVAAGDIACTQGDLPTATHCQQVATSDLTMSLHPNAVLPLGDDQYELGSLSDYQTMYDPAWGRLKSISYPVTGNHEWGYIGTAIEPTGAVGYFAYFGTRSHPLQPDCTSSCESWYSYDLGSWHMIALDSQCTAIGGCNPGNPEYNWLQNDLKADTAKCTLAYWHIPLFSSSQDHQPDMKSIYQLLDTKGVDVVLNGHAHFYERFGPQDANGTPEANGISEFIVGTGGRSFFAIRSTPAANSEARIANTFGVLHMTLSSTSYSWRFVPISGDASDAGSASCH